MTFEGPFKVPTLPAEVILQILLYVKTPYLTDIVRLTHISSAIRQLICSTPGYFSKITVKPCIKRADALLGFLKQVKHKDAITAIDLSGSVTPGNLALVFFHSFPNLESLDINNCRGFSFPDELWLVGSNKDC